MNENWGPYKWLWSHTTGEPYTWIIRRSQKNHPLVWLLCFLCLGFCIGVYAKRYWHALLIGLVFGLLSGHFWW